MLKSLNIINIKMTTYRKRYGTPSYYQDRRVYIDRTSHYLKYHTRLPPPLKFLQQNLFCDKLIHTENEKKLILRYK